ncbi:MAG: YerC/YecD family TrpR-related protein [Candidatus Pacebacteria bacterium]|nr:YerC/YecD family TrpR-related protein [Candidatus Paceibacterota bacterium]
MGKELSTKQASDLFGAILSLKTKKECQIFFRDLCTLSEIKGMVDRFQVAKMLQGNIPYRTISKKTGSSTATITRIAHWVHHGMGGYKLILKRIK